MVTSNKAERQAHHLNINNFCKLIFFKIKFMETMFYKLTDQIKSQKTTSCDIAGSTHFSKAGPASFVRQSYCKTPKPRQNNFWEIISHCSYGTSGDWLCLRKLARPFKSLSWLSWQRNKRLKNIPQCNWKVCNYIKLSKDRINNRVYTFCMVLQLFNKFIEDMRVGSLQSCCHNVFN